jgi:hypothetical protein
METRKRPSQFIAIVFTGLAVGSLTASVLLLARHSTKDEWMALQLLLSMLLTVAAIANWVVYFRKWVDFEIRSLEESTTTKQ